jgi:hypothetical protein
MKNKKIFSNGKWVIILIASIITVSSLAFSIMKVHAATMAARDYMNRNAQSLTTGVSHQVIFTPATNVSGGTGTNKVIMVFPDADDGLWCRTAGADLAVTTTSLNDSAVVLPGSSKVGTCAKGSGASSYDTITISGVDNLVAGTAYGFTVTDGSTGKLGTPSAETAIVTVKTNNGTSDVDTRNIVLAIVASDQITVTGKVDATMTLVISGTSMGFGSIVSGSTRYADNTGAGLASSAPNGQPATISVSTNGRSGAVVQVKDTNAAAATGLYLNSPATTLTSRASSAVAAGTAGFGVFGKNASTVTLDPGFDNNGAADLAISTTFQPVASLAAAGTGSFDLEAVAAVAAATPPGDYTDTLTVVATGKF